MDTITAMKQALVALEAALSDDKPYIIPSQDAITALRVAIEVQEKQNFRANKLEAEKGNYQLTINGISRAAAKRIAEEWAGGEMVWYHGAAYPSHDDHPCIISAITKPKELDLISKCFKCGHPKHAGGCVNVSPDYSSLSALEK